MYLVYKSAVWIGQPMGLQSPADTLGAIAWRGSKAGRPRRGQVGPKPSGMGAWMTTRAAVMGWTNASSAACRACRGASGSAE